jgi:hypothetical protein
MEAVVVGATFVGSIATPGVEPARAASRLCEVCCHPIEVRYTVEDDEVCHFEARAICL